MQQKPVRSFFIFGDSIAVGQFVPPHLTWATEICRRVHDRYDRFNWRMANVSISGNTTRQALERFGYDVQSHRPEFLYIQFGMNDCNFWKTDNGCPRVAPDAFKANLNEIGMRAFAWGARHLWFGTNHPASKPDADGSVDDAYQIRNAKYNAIVKEVARGFGRRATLVDHERSWRSLPSESSRRLLDDGIHLAVKGHRLYRDTTWPKIERDLDRLLCR